MVSRRRLLSTVAAAGTATLAGCTGGCGPSIPFVDSGMPQDGELAVEPADSAPDDAHVVVFDTLSSRERALADEAIGAGAVRLCVRDETERTRALHDFADRMETPETYLRRDGTTYGLWVRITDVVYAGAADSPPGDGNPCC
ncbi:MAG: hypothetical protein ABEJ70_02865 [Halobacteriaceae archaeon]